MRKEYPRRVQSCGRGARKRLEWLALQFLGRGGRCQDSTGTPSCFVSVASKRLTIFVSPLFAIVAASAVSIASKGVKFTVGGSLCRGGRTGTACRAPTNGGAAGRRGTEVIGRSIGGRLWRVL